MLRINRPLIDHRELAELKKVLDSGNLTQGPKVQEFEREIQKVVGTKYVFAMSSATTALHLSLVAMGVGPADEVLVSDFSWPASGNVVVQTGAKPVFVDVRPDSYAMDVDDLRKKLTRKSKAIMVVHPFGLSADMAPIMSFAKKHRLRVLEDAACALGAEYLGKPCGAIGHAGCFSFHPRKSITTGEGGAITTNDARLAQTISILRNHGGVRKQWRFVFEKSGFNYRMSDIQAAIGVAQIRKLKNILSERRKLAAGYKQLLGNHLALTIPIEPGECLHTYQSYVLVLEDQIDRDKVIQRMRERGIETTLGTYAMHAEPFYRKTYKYKRGQLPVSLRLCRQTLTLPLYPGMGLKNQRRVAKTLIDILAEQIQKRS